MNANNREMFATHRVASCSSVDDAREVLGDVFLPVEFPSTKVSASVGMDLNALTVGRITCGYMSFQEAVVLQTAEPDNYHVDIPTNSRAIMRASRGSRIDGTERTAGVFMPGRPVELDCSERFAQAALMIPRRELQFEVETLLDSTIVQPVEFHAELDLTATGGRTLLQTVHLIDEASRQADGALKHPLAVRRLEEVLIHALLFSQTHNLSAALTAPAPAAGERAVSRAVELLRSDPARPWTIYDLASQTSSSVRSLQEAFRRALDTTPMTYLRRLRLERVRDELLTATPGSVTVTDVAARWGFVHLGRFTAAYAERFGERPSDTMRSTARAD